MGRSQHRVTSVEDGKWLWLSLTTELNKDGGQPSHLLELLADAVESEIWTQHGMTFREFVTSPYPRGIGATEDQLKTLISLKHKFEDNDKAIEKRMKDLRKKVNRMLDDKLNRRQGPTSNNGNPDNCQDLEYGNSEKYIAARLIKDGKEDPKYQQIYDDWKDDKYRSARQAGIAAGFIKDTPRISAKATPEAIARQLKKKLDDEQIAELIRILLSGD